MYTKIRQRECSPRLPNSIRVAALGTTTLPPEQSGSPYPAMSEYAGPRSAQSFPS